MRRLFGRNYAENNEGEPHQYNERIAVKLP